MGFETVVPPEPTRGQELKALDRLEASWANQPYYRYYMNEDIRQIKYDYTLVKDKARWSMVKNILFISLFTVPLSYYARRFYVHGSLGNSLIPYTKPMAAFIKERTPFHDRFQAANKAGYKIYLLTTTFLAFLLFDSSIREDQNYDKYSKVARYL